MKIIYIHHGARKLSNPPTQNDDLTDIGYRDCELTAELLVNSKMVGTIKCIYTSPYFRCRKTAEIINKKLNVPIIDDDRLNEYVSSTEVWTNCQERLLNCIDDIIEKHNNDDIVICVTSGVNVGAFMLKAFGLSPSEKTPFLGVPSCSPIIFTFDKQ